MYFNGPYLRVLTPKTTNGMIPAFGPDGRQQFNETFAPLSARKQLEKKNARLEKTGYKHLKAIIEEVGGVVAVEDVKEIAKAKKVKR